MKTLPAKNNSSRKARLDDEINFFTRKGNHFVTMRGWAKEHIEFLATHWKISPQNAFRRLVNSEARRLGVKGVSRA